MQVVRLIRPAGVLAGLGLAPWVLALGLGLGSATVFSGCDDSKTTGRVAEMPEEVKQQQSSLQDEMDKVVKERRANARKGGAR
jgi:hypothetical protein